MAFFLSLLLFIGLAGWLDTRLPWPPPASKRRPLQGPRTSEGLQRLIAGHFGFAAAVKAREPEAPLRALMLATQWLDVAFVPLSLRTSRRSTSWVRRPAHLASAVVLASGLLTLGLDVAGL